MLKVYLQNNSIHNLVVLGLLFLTFSICNITIFAQPPYKETDLALFKAAREGNIEKLKTALNNCFNINIRDEDGMTALMLAVHYRHIEAVKLILEKLPQVNLSNNKGETALMSAAWQGDIDLVNILLEAKAAASLQSVDFVGNTVLIRSIMGRNPYVVSTIARISAIISQEIIDSKNIEGETALLWAAHGNYPTTIKLLLNLKADIKLKDNLDRTALITACQHYAQSEVLQILIDAGDNINHQDKLGKTALIYAIENPISDRHLNKQRLIVLLQAGANSGITDKEGKSAMDYAKSSNNKYVVDLLISAF
jgi:uncharacterized protein